MQWTLFTFRELNTDQLYELLRLRADVFVVEQNCVYGKATSLQHTWVSAYLQGLSSSARSRNTK